MIFTGSDSAKKPKQPLIAIEPPRHIICFVALPFDEEYTIVLEALRDVLEVAPYCWQVERADKTYFDLNIPNNIREWIGRSQCFAVEISDRNPNVMMELGLMHWGYPEKPLIILEKQGNTAKDLADLGGLRRIHYSWGDNPKSEHIVAKLRDEIGRDERFSSLRGERHYLSTRMLCETWITRDVAQTIARKYETVEELLELDASFISRELDIRTGLLRDIQDYLRNKIGIK